MTTPMSDIPAMDQQAPEGAKGRGLPEMPKALATLLATPRSASALAWTTSVVFHVVLFAIAILVLPPIVRGLHETSQEQVVIPDTTLSNDSDVGGVPNPGLGKDPTRDASQEN